VLQKRSTRNNYKHQFCKFIVSGRQGYRIPVERKGYFL